jgi:ribonuclease HII
VHIANIEGMRRAVAGLAEPPGYVLTDGFAVRGFGRPSLAVPKGDRVAACVAAASVLAKVTRDRLMVELDGDRPGYGFAVHKGYCTPEHDAALTELGPCPEHRYSFANVAAVAGRGRLAGLVHNGTSPDEECGDGVAASGDMDDDLWAEPDWDGWEPGLPEPMDVVMGVPAANSAGRTAP